MLKKALLLFLSVLSIASFAQDKNLSGKVYDESRIPLPGVSVSVKGTTAGTLTDVNGNFSINATKGQQIVFSFLGMVTKTIVYDNQTTLDVTLATDNKALEEVVVIGYQTIRKKDLTGAVSVINAEEAGRVSSNTLAQSIQGLSPGVSVRNGGGPAGGAVIEIRGAASFANTNPLYVIDGMIADANITINTDDIESIQILKDASAAAIYGSRAANGVIIMTTKKGKTGPAKLTFSAKYGIQDIAHKYDMMDAAEYAALKSQAFLNAGNNPPANISSARDLNIDTDWQDVVMRVGQQENYNVGLSGGTENSHYLVSTSYLKNKGTLIANSFNRASLRLNSDAKKGILTFGENLVFSQSAVRNPNGGNAFFDGPTMLPTIPVQSNTLISANNPKGYGYGTNEMPSYRWNYVAIADIATRTSKYSKIVGNAYADLKITDWLNYRFNAGLEASFDYIQAIMRDGTWLYAQQRGDSNVAETRQQFSSLLFDNTLNFNKSFGKHNINGVVGVTQQHTKNQFTMAQRYGLQQQGGDYFTTIGSGTGLSATDGGINTNYKIFGYLGRVNYNYDDKYLATFTARLDQDSRFGEEYRDGFFPSVSAAWRISKEDFFKVDWIDNLKINASYGELGIVTVGSWDYQGFVNSAPRAVFGANQFPYVGAYQAQLTNTDLKWENRIIKNIGLEGTIFRNVDFSIAAYNSLSKDALVQLPIPIYLGNSQGNPFVNAASIRNTGVEFELGYKNRKNAFKWDISGNFTTIKNEVVGLGNLGEGIDYIQAGDTRSKIGRSLGEWFVLQTDGLFQTTTEIAEYKNSEGTIIQPDARPGDIRFKDLNDDGTINNDDRAYSGSPWPTLQTGLQFNGVYKNFTLNIQMVGVFGATVYNAVRRDIDGYNLSNFRSDINPWSPTNTNTNDPRIGIFANENPSDVNSTLGLVQNAAGNTDRWLEDGSYLRLRNVELGYQLPKSLLTKIKVDNARVYVSGQNILTFTDYSGYDPDLTGNGILERGVDAGNWPSPRVISFGLQFGF
jgi:TonB-linked SusC/RagA family outer membrane protein